MPGRRTLPATSTTTDPVADPAATGGAVEAGEEPAGDAAAVEPAGDDGAVVGAGALGRVRWLDS
jgi:hypothetical protein